MSFRNSDSFDSFNSFRSQIHFDDCKYNENSFSVDKIKHLFKNGKHIRKLKLSDYKEYLILLSQLTVVGKVNEEEFKKRFNEIDNNPYLHIYVISDEDINELIACGTVYIEPKFIHKCSKLAHIEDIVVNKKYRGKNYGLFIINHLVDVAKKAGCYKVTLACKEKNKFFYEKCNFKNEGLEMAARL